MHHDTLLFEGRATGPGDLDKLRASSRRFVREELAAFLEEWHSDSPTVAVQSSGSTGTPKIMHVGKARMRASARMTCSFLVLRANDCALLCMPLRYIGAKMMVVRAMERGLDLHCVEPSGHPLKGLERAPDFLAVTPRRCFPRWKTRAKPNFCAKRGTSSSAAGPWTRRLPADSGIFPTPCGPPTA